MDNLTIFLLALGLAMDCFAVAFSQGLHRHQSPALVLWMAALFGLFQGGMPLISYVLGSFWADLLTRYAPWIALALLLTIGGKMLLNAYRHPQGEDSPSELSFGRIILLAIATSLDALSIGVLFVPCPESLWMGILAIFLVAAVLTLFGYGLGVRIGKKIPFSPDWIAGFILVFLGIKICLSYLLP